MEAARRAREQFEKYFVPGFTVLLFLLQAGGGFFDENGRSDIDTDVNAHVLATLVSWCVGDGRICGDAPNFTAGGNQLKAAQMLGLNRNTLRKKIRELDIHVTRGLK